MEKERLENERIEKETSTIAVAEKEILEKKLKH